MSMTHLDSLFLYSSSAIRPFSPRDVFGTSTDSRRLAALKLMAHKPVSLGCGDPSVCNEALSLGLLNAEAREDRRCWHWLSPPRCAGGGPNNV